MRGEQASSLLDEANGTDTDSLSSPGQFLPFDEFFVRLRTEAGGRQTLSEAWVPKHHQITAIPRRTVGKSF